MFSPIIWLWTSKWWKNKKDISQIVENHVKNNAKEFFCWYNPPYWHNNFWFEVSPNGRFAEHEQITDFESLNETVEQVHKYWLKIMWNLNHWYYTDVVENQFKMIVDDFLKTDIDGFIVGSMWALEYLDNISEWTWQKWYIINWKKIQLNISTILAIYNEQAIQFLKENYPIYKIILSREITLSEIENLINKFPDLIFEVFGEGDFCRYNNWLCFAEHKYTDRDICTIVVNDLIVKKSIRYDYRKIIQDKNLTNNEKVELFDNTYKDEFEQLEELLESYLVEENQEILDNILQLIKQIITKYILFYDPLQWPRTKHNKDFIIYLNVIKLLKEKNISIEDINYFKNIDNLYNYILTEKNFWLKQYSENLKELTWWKFGISTKYKDNFYNRADNLNLFSYVFFDKFKNIDTVKFPTRWRNYLPKLQIIKECIENKEKIFKYIDLNVSYQRTHYDLKYLFDNNKYWFYDIRKKIHNLFNSN